MRFSDIFEQQRAKTGFTPAEVDKAITRPDFRYQVKGHPGQERRVNLDRTPHVIVAVDVEHDVAVTTFPLHPIALREDVKRAIADGVL